MIEVLREQAGGFAPVYDLVVPGMKTTGLMTNALGEIVEVDTTRRRAHLDQGLTGVPPENNEELLKILGLSSKFPEGKYEGYVHVLITPPSEGSRTKVAHSGRWGAIFLLHTDSTEGDLEENSSPAMEFKVTNRLEGNQRVQLIIDGLVWNEITGPTAVAVSELIDRKPQFDEREMKIIRAMFAGKISAAKLSEGGDYTYAIWNQGLTRDEMDAFLEKIG